MKFCFIFFNLLKRRFKPNILKLGLIDFILLLLLITWFKGAYTSKGETGKEREMDKEEREREGGRERSEGDGRERTGLPYANSIWIRPCCANLNQFSCRTPAEYSFQLTI